MSNYKRNSPFANAALVVSVNHEQHFSKEDIFAGLRLRRDLETRAFQAILNQGGSKELPTQRLEDFMAGRPSQKLEKGSSPSGAMPVRLDEILPTFMTSKLREGIQTFNKNMKGFANESAQLYGIESRTSCPVRVTRDQDTLQSLSHRGLYPAGEGAGYAGGITSAACDGVRIADKIAELISSVGTARPLHTEPVSSDKASKI